MGVSSLGGFGRCLNSGYKYIALHNNVKSFIASHNFRWIGVDFRSFQQGLLNLLATAHAYRGRMTARGPGAENHGIAAH
jgi:hypothetical protein